MRDEELVREFLNILKTENPNHLNAVKLNLIERVTGGDISDMKSGLILNLALQLRDLHFLLEEIAGQQIFQAPDIEPGLMEEEALKEMLEDELDEVGLGNVVMFKDMKKKGQNDTDND